MPATKAKPSGKPSKVQTAPRAASEPAQSAAPAPKPHETVATVTPEQRAQLEGTTLRKRKKAQPIPEIDSSPVRPKYARRGRPKKGTTPLNETELQAAATTSASSTPDPTRTSNATGTSSATGTSILTNTSRPTLEVVGEVTATLPLEDDLPVAAAARSQFKGPGAKRLKAIDKAQKTTQSNQVLTQVKAGPRRSSATSTKPQVEQLSAANLGYLDGFVSQLQQPKPHAQANTLSTGYSLQDRAQATAAMAPNASARTLSYEPCEAYQGPKLTPSPAFFEDDEPAVLPFAPITGATPRSAQPPRLMPPRPAPRPAPQPAASAPSAASARRSAQPQLLNVDAALEPEPKTCAASAPQTGSAEASFLDQPLSPEIELMVIDPRYESDFALPQYESELAAGIDLRAMFDYDVVLEPNQTMLVPTGIALNMGRSGMCATVLPRSGLGFRQGIVLGNLVGLIDADYQGELMVPLWNRSDAPFTITVGMRIAQLVFLPIIRPHFKRVTKFTPTQRGTKGFGSTDTD